MRDRHDSGRSSMKSDDMKPTIKIERSPPVFPETVGTRSEMTPDEFYAQSLRLDFPRSTLGKMLSKPSFRQVHHNFVRIFDFI